MVALNQSGDGVIRIYLLKMDVGNRIGEVKVQVRLRRNRATDASEEHLEIESVSGTVAGEPAILTALIDTKVTIALKHPEISVDIAPAYIVDVPRTKKGFQVVFETCNENQTSIGPKLTTLTRQHAKELKHPWTYLCTMGSFTFTGDPLQHCSLRSHNQFCLDKSVKVIFYLFLCVGSFYRNFCSL